MEKLNWFFHQEMHYLDRNIAEQTARECYPEIREFTYDILWNDLPKEVQELIALELGISAARVYGVVSFYSFFTMKPKGKYPISVCMGTACYVRGGEKVLDEFRRQLGIEVGGTTPDGLFSLDSLRCVGACGLAPVVMIGPRVYGRLKVTDVKGILDEIQALEKEI
jgi:NADH-quinone oxidoreductase subunit E/NADP-reducing hydrogenase subunit HndA